MIGKEVKGKRRTGRAEVKVIKAMERDMVIKDGVEDTEKGAEAAGEESHVLQTASFKKVGAVSQERMVWTLRT